MVAPYLFITKVAIKKAQQIAMPLILFCIKPYTVDFLNVFSATYQYHKSVVLQLHFKTCRKAMSTSKDCVNLTLQVFLCFDTISSIQSQLLGTCEVPQLMPCATIASATFLKPAMFAPATRL